MAENRDGSWVKGELDELREWCDKLQAENQRLREACEIFRRYGLPPHDVSGSSEWKRAMWLVDQGGE